MCGICGIYHLDGEPVLKNQLEAMNATMFHRGPDGDGLFVQDEVGLAHRRLSIIDLEGGHQPMAIADGGIHVVFNGEIYNFLELKDFLQAKGHRFQTRSDTESILNGYAEWGERVAEHLRGMFAFALWDNRHKKLILARDRVGKKPLYYFHDGRRLAFGSELKSLLELPWMPRQIDLQALDAYLSFGYVPSPLSIFKHIRKLPPAHIAVCTPTNFQIRPYWHLDMENTSDPASTNEATLTEELTSILDECVQLRLISDVPLGAFLSGGVDSGAVVASMARQSAEPIKTASIGFSDKQFDELAYARQVAGRYHTDHAEFVVEPNALELIDKLVWHFDEPFADSSAIPTYYVSQMARRQVTVALSGDGGDEVFAGYSQRYSMNRLEAHIRNKIPRPIRTGLIGPVSRIYPKLETFPRPFRLKNFLSSLSRSFEEAYFRDMSFYFLPEMKSRLYTADTAAAVQDCNAFDILGIHFAANANPDPTTRVQYVDIKTYMTEDILVKVDRMSMANSLEVRSPLLDHKLMEFVGRLSSAWKLRAGESKYIFKKMNEDRLPREVLYRKKQGFRIPLARWMREDLKTFAYETLFSDTSGLNTYFDLSYVQKLWQVHQSGRQDLSTPLWGLMMFERWRRQFL
jgi:asparagine synthase (glutamine-hydrolysing)